jgi:hypothetical protein
VPGVKAGHCTRIEGDGELIVGRGPIRTGVTVIFPNDDIFHDHVPAGRFVMNEYGIGAFNGSAKNRPNRDRALLYVGRVMLNLFGKAAYSQADLDHSANPVLAIGGALAIFPDFKPSLEGADDRANLARAVLAKGASTAEVKQFTADFLFTLKFQADFSFLTTQRPGDDLQDRRARAQMQFFSEWSRHHQMLWFVALPILLAGLLGFAFNAKKCVRKDSLIVSINKKLQSSTNITKLTNGGKYENFYQAFADTGVDAFDEFAEF